MHEETEWRGRGMAVHAHCPQSSFWLWLPLPNPCPLPSYSLTTPQRSTCFCRRVTWGKNYVSKMAATWTSPDGQKKRCCDGYCEHRLFWLQKFGDNPNTSPEREADLLSLFYTYKDLAADNSTSSTKPLPDGHDAAGALLGIWKYTFQEHMVSALKSRGVDGCSPKPSGRKVKAEMLESTLDATPHQMSLKDQEVLSPVFSWVAICT